MAVITQQGIITITDFEGIQYTINTAEFELFEVKVTNLAIGAGDTINDYFTVDADAVIDVDFVSFEHLGVRPTEVFYSILHSGVHYIFFTERDPLSSRHYVQYPAIILFPSAVVKYNIRGGTAGNDIQLTLVGRLYRTIN